MIKCIRRNDSAVLTHDINGAHRASDAFWIVFDHICSLENTLNRASFDIELIVAKAITASWPFSKDFPSQKSVAKQVLEERLAYRSSGEKFQSVTAP